MASQCQIANMNTWLLEAIAIRFTALHGSRRFLGATKSDTWYHKGRCMKRRGTGFALIFLVECILGSIMCTKEQEIMSN